MAVQVPEKVVDILRSGGIAGPFFNVEVQKRLFGMVFGGLIDTDKMSRKVMAE